MPSSSKKSYGPEVQARVRCLLQAILESVAGDRELGHGIELRSRWSTDEVLTIETTLRSLVQVSQPTLNANTSAFKRAKSQAGETLIALRDFVSILDDHRVQKQGSDRWQFSLRLWGKDTDRNLAEFDKLWASKRSPAAKLNSPPISAPATPPPSPLKPGAPVPRVRLPENYVERPAALKAVKAKLLATDDRPLVVSAIAGLGGLGKSVLATALVLDPEVQVRFTDGILWVTLGQSPDLQTLLGDWIRELDKSRDAFSATTLESASRYLQTLLAERRMLLVVDDVWNAAHAEWFRVGGADCRVLVTTREAQVEGADYYALDLMTEEEALDLVRQKLGQRWRAEQEGAVSAFAKLLGYLPLALDLAANQVRDGLSWAELTAEFAAERRAVALELLDSSEAWEQLDEEQQRKYSLRACFNLSLKRLKPAQLQQFAWLGVLPEDVTLAAPVAAVLWDLPPLPTKKALIDLRRRSFLTDGVASFDGDPTYRIHDLMHDTARSLIESGTLTPPSTPHPPHSALRTPHPLPLAHQQFLQRYRAKATDQRWDKLPKDGYSHRHLSWHLEQADWAEELHALLALSDERGNNAWFEACDRIGQPAIFVEDVARAWALADASYEKVAENSLAKADAAPQRRGPQPTPAHQRLQQRHHDLQAAWELKQTQIAQLRQAFTIEAGAAVRFQLEQQLQAAEAELADLSAELDSLEAELAGHATAELPQDTAEPETARWIALQCRYALITATLNSLVANLSGNLMAAFVKGDFWTVEQAWAYVEQMQDEYKVAEAIQALAPYLSKPLFQVALGKARAMQYESGRAQVLTDLAKIDRAYFPEALAAARAIQHGHPVQADVLRDLATIDGAYWSEALDAARAIQDEEFRARVLRDLATTDGAYWSEALDAARAVQNESWRAMMLKDLAKIEGADFSELLEAAWAIENEYTRAEMLKDLVKINGADFSGLLEATLAIWDESRFAYMLRDLATIDRADFSGLLEAARAIGNEYMRIWVLRDLATIDRADFSGLLEAARAIGNEYMRVWVLRDLAKIEGADLAGLLEAARAIQDEHMRAEVLTDLATKGADFSGLLEVARTVQGEFTRVWVLGDLAKIEGADLAGLLEAARAIQDEDSRAEVLRDLTKIDRAYFSEALAAARAMQDESRRAYVLTDLAKIDRAYFSEALVAARAMQDESSRAEMLTDLAKIDGADFSGLLAAARAIQHENRRAYVLMDLATINGAYWSEALAAARAIQDKYSRAFVLRDLATIDRVDFSEALAATRVIPGFRGVWALIHLATIDGAYWSEALAAARAMQDEGDRAGVLSYLAEIDRAYFSEALAAARAIQNDDSRAYVLTDLAKIDRAYFSEALAAARAMQNDDSRAYVLTDLAKIDRAYFSEALAAARAMQYENTRAGVLTDLAKIDGVDFYELLVAAGAIQDESKCVSVLTSVVSNLAKIDGADFSELSAAVRAIQSQTIWAKVFSNLAYFSEALAVARAIQNEYSRAQMLRDLAQQVPQDLLSQVGEAIFELTHKPYCAEALSGCLPRLSLATLPYAGWLECLHLLAHRQRSDLMQDLVTLYPAICHLGGEAAMRGVVAAMGEVCGQWR